jgi:hypothetical protein
VDQDHHQQDHTQKVVHVLKVAIEKDGKISFKNKSKINNLKICFFLFNKAQEVVHIKNIHVDVHHHHITDPATVVHHQATLQTD